MRYLNIIAVILLLNSCSNPNSKTTNKETPIDTVTVEQTIPTEPTLEPDTASEQEIDEEPVTFDSTGKPSRPVFRNLQVDTSQLFGVWTQDLSYPTAEFMLSKKYYLIADYDGNGATPYILDKDILTVFFEYGKSVGRINRTENDTLSITWDNEDPEQSYEITYFRFDD